MVKRATRRRYYARRTKKIMRNYFKARLDCIQTIQHTTDGTNFRENNQATRTLPALLELCNDWGMYRQLFHSFRLTGFAIQVTPLSTSPTQAGQPYTSLASIVLALQTNRDNADFNSVSEANTSIVLTPYAPQRRYKSFNGGEFGWTSTDDLTLMDGVMRLGTNGNASTGACVWSVRFSFYITFKNPN